MPDDQPQMIKVITRELYALLRTQYSHLSFIVENSSGSCLQITGYIPGVQSNHPRNKRIALFTTMLFTIEVHNVSLFLVSYSLDAINEATTTRSYDLQQPKSLDEILADIAEMVVIADETIPIS